MKSYKDLVVWQKSFELTILVYRLTRSFPKEELYVLVPQMRRSALSIPSNIAEGYARRSRKEYRQFISTAYASGAELETQLMLSKELKFLKQRQYHNAMDLLIEVLKMLNVLGSRLSK